MNQRSCKASFITTQQIKVLSMTSRTNFMNLVFKMHRSKIAPPEDKEYLNETHYSKSASYMKKDNILKLYNSQYVNIQRNQHSFE